MPVASLPLVHVQVLATHVFCAFRLKEPVHEAHLLALFVVHKLPVTAVPLVHVQTFALHVAGVNAPARHDEVPDTVYPELHDGVHVAPDARVVVQFPLVPCAMVTVLISQAFGETPMTVNAAPCTGHDRTGVYDQPDAVEIAPRSDTFTLVLGTPGVVTVTPRVAHSATVLVLQRLATQAVLLEFERNPAGHEAHFAAPWVGQFVPVAGVPPTHVQLFSSQVTRPSGRPSWWCPESHVPQMCLLCTLQSRMSVGTVPLVHVQIFATQAVLLEFQ